jgi:1-acyl-sn-glycerol-3-phosphate acyltransferase
LNATESRDGRGRTGVPEASDRKRAALPDALPPTMPQFPHHGWRGIFRATVRVSGWRLEGTLPDVPRAVLIAAPHSSWWDGVHGLLFKIALGVDIKFMAKREVFAGPLGWLLRKLGGMPIERSAAHGVVEQMHALFRTREKLWLGITPEGTRKHVAQWKSGFWHIARDANVPIVPIYFDYPRKVIGVGPLFEATPDMDADIAALRAFYQPFKGKHRGV